MIIKQIGEFTGNIITTILRNRGIENPEKFLNPSISDYVTNVYNIKNIQIGVETFLEHLSSNSRIGLLVDSDVDGIASASSLYNFIQEFTGGYENIVYFMHDDKSHGLSKKHIEQIIEQNVNFLIIADASTSDVKEIEELYAKGIEVLVIDHHEPEDGYEKTKAILINNQLDFTNKEFVGAGMVLNFLRVVAERTQRPIASKLIDLVALGQIADQSDVSNPEIRGLVFYGLQNIKNPFLKHLVQAEGLIEGSITPKDISFSIAPLINAIIRMGSIEEKEYLFRAFAGINPNEQFFVDKKKKNKEGKMDKYVAQMNLYEYVYDLAGRLRGKQSRLVKKEVETLKKNVFIKGIGIGYISENAKALSGLIAGRMADEYGVPFLALRESEEAFKGSGRGNEKVLPDFKQWLTNTKLFEFVSGHANAFGVGITKENMETLKEGLDDIAKALTKNSTQPSEPTYEVDLIIDGKVDKELVHILETYKGMFGGKIKEPLIAFTNVSVNKKLISYKGSTLNFFEDKMKFVKFGENLDGELEDVLSKYYGDRVLVDFVGTLEMNVWNGNATPQMKVKAYQIKEKPVQKLTIDTIVF